MSMLRTKPWPKWTWKMRRPDRNSCCRSTLAGCRPLVSSKATSEVLRGLIFGEGVGPNLGDAPLLPARDPPWDPGRPPPDPDDTTSGGINELLAEGPPTGPKTGVPVAVRRGVEGAEALWERRGNFFARSASTLSALRRELAVLAAVPAVGPDLARAGISEGAAMGPERGEGKVAHRETSGCLPAARLSLLLLLPRLLRARWAGTEHAEAGAELAA